MLSGLILTSLILWIVGFFINGFSLYNFMLLVPTIMFAVRKIGIHVRYSNIVATEILLLFFSITWRLLFHKFFIIKFLLCIIVRIIFLCIVIYDDTVYIYVSEERKKI